VSDQHTKLLLKFYNNCNKSIILLSVSIKRLLVVTLPTNSDAPKSRKYYSVSQQSQPRNILILISHHIQTINLYTSELSDCATPHKPILHIHYYNNTIIIIIITITCTARLQLLLIL